MVNSYALQGVGTIPVPFIIFNIIEEDEIWGRCEFDRRSIGFSCETRIENFTTGCFEFDYVIKKSYAQIEFLVVYTVQVVSLVRPIIAIHPRTCVFDVIITRKLYTMSMGKRMVLLDNTMDVVMRLEYFYMPAVFISIRWKIKSELLEFLQ